MKRYIAIALVIGILIGFGINLIYFKLRESTKSWHYVTSFILASYNREDVEMDNREVVEIAYSYPNVYNTTSPSFIVKGDFWRIRWETIPYYNYTYYTGSILYYIYHHYEPAPSIFGIFKDGEVVGLMQVFKPSIYNVTHWGGIHSGEKDIYYALTREYTYVPIRSPYTLMMGKGAYYISAQCITGCFNFTIEEYY
jgi:hypothetical protein